MSEFLGDHWQKLRTPANAKLISRVAPTNSTVLILGETGTGKELVARAIHDNSPRKNKTMVKVNCATLPANLIESELFGHERAALPAQQTGGWANLSRHITVPSSSMRSAKCPWNYRSNYFALCRKKRLSVSADTIRYRSMSRIIAATNRDLAKEVEAGRFRADLYYRLNIFPIPLPSLRTRREDIPSLTITLSNKLSKKVGKKIYKNQQVCSRTDHQL